MGPTDDTAEGASQLPAVLPDEFGESRQTRLVGTASSDDRTLERTSARSGTGLALSGGGFRATLFGLGSLWRLNELGLLRTMARITSVSGGSLVAGVLAAHWKQLVFDGEGRATNFQELVAEPLRRFCARSLDWKVALLGLVPFLSASQLAARSFAKHLTRMKNGRSATLEDLPQAGDGLEFIFYATCMAASTGSAMARMVSRVIQVLAPRSGTAGRFLTAIKLMPRPAKDLVIPAELPPTLVMAVRTLGGGRTPAFVTALRVWLSRVDIRPRAGRSCMFCTRGIRASRFLAR